MTDAEAPFARHRDGLLRLKGDKSSKIVAGYARQLSHPAYENLLRSETFLRRLVPVLIVLFLAIAGVARWMSLVSQAENLRSQVETEMHFIAELVEQKLINKFENTDLAQPEYALQNMLSDTITAKFIEEGRKVVLTDRESNVVALVPFQADVIGKPINELTGNISILTQFGKRADTVHIELSNGEPAMAVHRHFPVPFGGVTLIQPEANLFQEWNRTASMNVTLFVGTSSILLVILYAYFAQSARAREADGIYFEVQNRFDTALMRGGCGLWDWDLSRGQFYWSKSMYDLLGLETRDEIIGFSEVASMVHGVDVDLYEIACKVLDQQLSHIEQVFRMRHANDKWVWIRLKVELTGNDINRPRLVGIAEDITEQRALEKETEQKDMRLHDAIENLPEAFVLWDDKRRLVLCNSKYQQLHRLDPDYISPGMNYNEVMDLATSPSVSNQLVRNIDQRDEDSATRTLEAQLDDGRWIQINERHTKDGGFVSVGTDITPIKVHETRLMESEKRLMATISDLETSRQTLEEQKRKLAEMAEKYAAETHRAEAANRSKSQFLANISHELRTPLNAIIGFSEIMNEGMFGPLGSAKYEEYARDIHESGSYLLGMINDVLDMSKIEAGRFPLEYQVFNLEDMIEETLRIVSHQSQERNLSIEDSIAPKIKLEADRRAIKQILINLLSNAVKFSNDSGGIQIRARRRDNSVTITIEDNGIGISPQNLRKLGKPFEQVQNQFTKSHKGSGLGLAISRSLTELHGGAMKIRSKEGNGTIVSLRLPINKPKIIDAKIAAE